MGAIWNTRTFHLIISEVGKYQERKSSLNITFLGGISRRCPVEYLGGRPYPKTFTPSLGAQENKVFCADAHDPKARTSMTQGGKILYAGNFQADFWFPNLSGGTKRDKLKGTNARNSQFFADFRRFLLIFAFPGNYSILEAQIFAENRRKPQIFAENRRFLQKPVCPI